MKKSVFAAALAASVLSINMAFATPAQAVEQARNHATEVIHILQKANGSNNAAIRRQAENYAMPYFDFERMTAAVVRAPWRTATPEQKRELVQELKELLIRTYAGSMFQFKDAKISVSDKAVQTGNVVEVSATVNHKGKQNVLKFYTYQSGGKYRVFDVEMQGLKMTSSLSSQYQPVLKSKGVAGLIAELKAKNGK